MLEANNKKYQYNCQNSSLLEPYYKKYIASPIHKIIPRSVSANLISILGQLCIVLAFCLTLEYKINLHLALIDSVLMQLYMLLDTLDGIQARTTGTSSPLGEYIDHSGDSFIGPLVTLLCSKLILPHHNLLALILAFISGLLFNILINEKSLTGRYMLPAVGDLESVTMCSILVVVSQLHVVKSLPILFNAGLNLYQIAIIAIGISCAIIESTKSLRRAKKVTSRHLFSYVMAILWLLVLIYSPTTSLVKELSLIFLLSTQYATTNFSILTQRQKTNPDYFFSTIIVTCFALTLCGIHIYPILFKCMFTYQIVYFLKHLTKVFGTFKHYWKWKNAT